MGKDTATNVGGQQKSFSADTVSVLLMALGSTSISRDQYNMMSALDGTRTADAFQHQFRAVLAKAKDLRARVDGGEQFQAVQPSKKRGSANVIDSTGSPTPKKKARNVTKPRAKKVKSPVEEDSGTEHMKLPRSVSGSQGNEEGDILVDGEEAMIKQERDWDDAI